jgi:mannose-6-phosphate isomerase-like protein (cupin superfamily)
MNKGKSGFIELRIFTSLRGRQLALTIDDLRDLRHFPEPLSRHLIAGARPNRAQPNCSGRRQWPRCRSPLARTAWHTHPLGQALIVTAGRGWVQADGAPRQEINVGDVVWIPAGEKHWHGATATDAMTHFAVAEPSTARALTGWNM